MEWKEGIIKAPVQIAGRSMSRGNSDMIMTHLEDKTPPPVLVAAGG